MADNMKRERQTVDDGVQEVPEPGDLFPRMSVGIMGSAGGKLPTEVRRKVRRLGVAIAKRGYVLITGACPGLPHEAVKGAKEAGGIVVGVSPALNLEEHILRHGAMTPSSTPAAVSWAGRLRTSGAVT
jgi:predicted Rossmann-fold nucleotide-binding protein